MEMIVVVIICLALIVFGGMTMAQGFVSSTDSAAISVEDITVTKGEIMRTGISLLSARQTAIDRLEVALRNNGQMKLASFSK
ncbi:hypothetical protein ACFLWZ_06560 [Chloroflexota bacterium]